jgi:F-type H+-transporting ATPase subunit gamma
MPAKTTLGKFFSLSLSCLTSPDLAFSRNAMDNASKNAGEMIGTLTMQYNRGRQAAITNELVDIITGASAL